MMTDDAWFAIPLAAAIAFAAAALLAGWIVSRRPTRWLIDHPNERSLHEQPVSRAGGLAILLGLACGCTVVALYAPPDPAYVWVLAGALLIAAVSFADDLAGIAPAVRVAFHLAASGCVVIAGLSVERIGLPWTSLNLGTVPGVAFTVLFVAWLVNLYNFMDGMDGFAGGMSAIGFSALALLCMLGDAIILAAACAVVSACTLGFLPYNFPPARIFMGDLGASLLGYLCAVTMLAAERLASIPLWVPVLAFSPFIVDASVTLVRRIVAGEAPWRAHRTHFYQRLVRLGWGHRKTVVRQYALMLACACSAVAAPWLTPLGQGLLIGAWVAVYAALMIGVANLEREART